MSLDPPYDDARDAFTEANARFQESLSSAFAAHTRCVATFLTTLSRVERREDDLQESVAELKALIREQGGHLTDLRHDVTDLRQRLEGGTP